MKKTILNFRMICHFILSALLIGISLIYIFESPSIGLFILFLILGLVVGLIGLTRPYAYVFSAEKLIIRYCFGFHVVIEWQNVIGISKHISITPASSVLSFLDCFFGTYLFTLKKESYGKKAFFTLNEINANRRTKELIHKRWNGKIV